MEPSWHVYEYGCQPLVTVSEHELLLLFKK